jgi:hypothetical protein
MANTVKLGLSDMNHPGGVGPEWLTHFVPLVLGARTDARPQPERTGRFGSKQRLYRSGAKALPSIPPTCFRQERWTNQARC